MAPMQRCMRYSAGALCAAGLALASVFSAGPASAHATARSGPATSAGPHAAAGLPVNYSFATGYAENFAAPAVSPPGANNWSCRRIAAHPYPVVLVHGTFENMNDNWQAASPILAQRTHWRRLRGMRRAGGGLGLPGQLNAGGATVPGVSYTVIESRDDEVVTPYTSAFLMGPGVTDITVQNQCPLDQSDHLELAYDPVAMADMLNALNPASRVSVRCVPVLPVTGPVGPVPPF